MNKLQTTCLLAVILSAAAVNAAAAPVGLVRSSTEFLIDGAMLSGNATVFEGSSLETGRGAAALSVGSASQISVAAFSRGRVFRDHFELTAGAVHVAGRYSVDSGPVRIAAAADSEIEVGSKANATSVRSNRGTAEVRNRAGVLVARVTPGSAVRFSQDEGGSVITRLTGTLQKKGKRFLLRDETNGITVEVRGTGLEKLAGKRVQIEGQLMPASGEGVQVVAVTQARVAAVAATGAGGKAAPAAIASGLGKGTIAVLGGVTVAATVGTIFAADAITADKEPSASLP